MLKWGETAGIGQGNGELLKLAYFRLHCVQLYR